MHLTNTDSSSPLLRKENIALFENNGLNGSVRITVIGLKLNQLSTHVTYMYHIFFSYIVNSIIVVSCELKLAWGNTVPCYM